MRFFLLSKRLKSIVLTAVSPSNEKPPRPGGLFARFASSREKPKKPGLSVGCLLFLFLADEDDLHGFFHENFDSNKYNAAESDLQEVGFLNYRILMIYSSIAGD